MKLLNYRYSRGIPFQISCCFLVCFFYLPSLLAQQIYVKTGTTGDGSSWENATGDLKSVLDTISYSSEIWIAEGVYYPRTCTDCQEADRAISFDIPDGVALYGGFTGNEILLSQRNWTAHPTIFSGNIDQDETTTSNSFSIIYTYNVSERTILDGVIIRDGMANQVASTDNDRGRGGGAWFNESDLNSSPTIRNCQFKNNKAIASGGALYNKVKDQAICKSTIRNCTFSGNISEDGGGAIYNDANNSFGECSPDILNCIFELNQAVYGGAVYNSGISGTASPNIINCRFTSNQVGFYGGACYNFGKADGNSSPLIVNCVFASNEASSAGAVYNLGDSGSARPKIINSTFYGNTANTGAAVYGNESNNGVTELTIANCIFWNNMAGFNSIFHMSGNASPTINMSYSLVDAADCEQVMFVNESHHFNCGEGILYNEDPIFLDPVNADFRLKDTSPAMDVGTNEVLLSNHIFFDIDSLIRVENETVDLGAYEYGSSLYEPLVIEIQPISEEVCLGEKVNFDITVSDAENITYQWQKDGIPLSATEAMLNIDSVIIEDLGVYRCRITAFPEDTIYSNEVFITVTIPDNPGVVIAVEDSTVCDTTTINFWTIPFNGGSKPSFDWKVNGVNVGNLDSVFLVDNLSDGDQVSCVMTTITDCQDTIDVTSNLIEINIENCIPTTIKEELTHLINLFPNPVKDIITLQSNNIEGVLDLQIFDVNQRLYFNDRMILSPQNSSMEIDVSTFLPGVYWFKMTKNKACFLKRIIIID